MSIEDEIDFAYVYKKLMAEAQEIVKEYHHVPDWKEDLLQYLLLKSQEQEGKMRTKLLRSRVLNELYDVIR